MTVPALEAMYQFRPRVVQMPGEITSRREYRAVSNGI